MLVLGVAAGLVWLWLAAPAEWEARDTGLVLTEAASKGQFSVIVTFVLIGAVASLMAGWAVGWRAHDLGWVLTPLVVVGTVAAAVVAWRVGVLLGPPDPTTATGVTVGDRVPAELEVDGIAPFLVWPIFGLLGLIVATWVSRTHDDAPSETL
jgi:hypothetical protein